MAPRALIAGNWKMNLDRAAAEALAATLALDGSQVAADLAVCPPAVYLAPVGSALAGSGVALGGQDCHVSSSGAHTGDVAAEMLADLGCAYVIVGHSERRADHGESDATVRAKAEAARRAGLVPIVCVGETEAERDAGKTLQVVESQVRGSVPGGLTGATLVVAYEPVWAIGTGVTASPEQAQDVHRHIRGRLEALDADIAAGVQILYGGSMKGENAAGLLAKPDIDGGLIGGASLKAEDFLAIAQAAARN